jgi:hypothetical protein
VAFEPEAHAKVRLPWGIHAKLSFVWHTKREKLGFRLAKREKE